jgi:hypothetical protein
MIAADPPGSAQRAQQPREALARLRYRVEHGGENSVIERFLAVGIAGAAVAEAPRRRTQAIGEKNCRRSSRSGDDRRSSAALRKILSDSVAISSARLNLQQEYRAGMLVKSGSAFRAGSSGRPRAASLHRKGGLRSAAAPLAKDGRRHDVADQLWSGPTNRAAARPARSPASRR